MHEKGVLRDGEALWTGGGATNSALFRAKRYCDQLRNLLAGVYIMPLHCSKCPHSNAVQFLVWDHLYLANQELQQSIIPRSLGLNNATTCCRLKYDGAGAFSTLLYQNVTFLAAI